MTEQVLIERDGPIVTVTLNRADKKNALTAGMYSSIADLLEEAEKDLSIRAVIFTGSGDAFTAGNDISDFLNNPPNGTDSPVFRVLFGLAKATVPTIAAVNGMAVGIGTTMLMHCDFAYAAEDAVFHMPFINLAVVPEAASSLLLPSQVGYRKAAELLMLGRPVKAKEAVDIGLINSIVPADDLLKTARATAEQLAAKPPKALRQTKALLRRRAEGLDERTAVEAKAFGERLASAEAKEAFSAFLEKRAPDFSKLG
ncbi:enoyl-CoA hydratase [Alphaproteobacteria bacterium]|jgi:enoyl-CoA hydratase/carnithine racemase|nr:enoyl-CoA hydratase [Alphaproteobacteria bacterium]